MNNVLRPSTRIRILMRNAWNLPLRIKSIHIPPQRTPEPTVKFYRCRRCGFIFYFARWRLVEKEYGSPYFGKVKYRTLVPTCPRCGSEDIEEVNNFASYY